MDQPTGPDAFSRGFRIRNRALRTLLIFFGPAQGSSQSDPRKRAEREYERRKELHHQWLRSQDQGEDASS